MAQLSQSERRLVDDLLECIAEAMSDVESVDSAYANKTKLQKLLYLAIEEFDLSITYSWYLAGAVLPEDAATPQTLQSAFGRLDSPDTPSIDTEQQAASDQDGQSDGFDDSIVEFSVAEDDAETVDDAAPEPSIPEASIEDDSAVDPVLFSGVPDEASPGPNEQPSDPKVAGHSRDDIVDFYRSELPNVWKQNTMRFLQNFYLEYAPQQYRDLYVQSTHLRIRLKDIEQAIEARLAGEEPTTEMDQLVRQAGLDISDLHMSIREHEALQETFDYFVRGTDVIEDALMTLANQQPSELLPAHIDVLQQIQDFYYYYVWRYPCLIISQETATGPSAGALRDEREDQLGSFESTLEAKLESLEAAVSQAGLQPSYSDYPMTDDSVSNAIGDLTNQYFDQ